MEDVFEEVCKYNRKKQTKHHELLRTFQMSIKDCMNSPDEQCPIKSAATVKHQMVRSPANFAKLKCNTDLNIPPSNWCSFNSYGFQHALTQSTGFSRFVLVLFFYLKNIKMIF